jgi:hypothetical protein
MAFGDPDRFKQIMEMHLTEFMNTMYRHHQKQKRFEELTKEATPEAALYFLHRWKYGML